MPGRSSRTLLPVVLALGFAVVLPDAAQATTCSPRAGVTQAGGVLTAKAISLCRVSPLPPGEPTPVEVVDDSGALQRIDPNTGTWYTVTTGTGYFAYTCLGTATNTYRVVNVSGGLTSGSLTAACG